ncbi:hypothetical protein [Falsiroseomonas sp. E2-1-a20]|uniref:hypothetical protein n=1 Tax=Falsiroseomonas sp. E2-1-a20 TaxID=3239300 RepID=UPI003F34B6C5
MERIKVELQHAPLSTIGAVTGVFTLIFDLIPSPSGSASVTLTPKLQLAVAIAASTTLCFVFPYLISRLLYRRFLYSRLFYLMAGIVAALLCNAQFAAFFPYRGASGGPERFYMFVIGMLLAAFYLAVFEQTERIKNHGTSISMYGFIFLVVVGSVQAAIIASGVQLDFCNRSCQSC